MDGRKPCESANRGESAHPSAPHHRLPPVARAGAELPFIATLQGQSVSDYQRCADLYERHGVDLAALPRVGVGSICRRSHSGEVEQIVRSLAGRGLRLHTFGAKVLGLSRYADAVRSSDSLSWSFRGRHVPGCSPSHRSESNCVHFALAWHTRLLASLSATDAGDNDDSPEPQGRVRSLPTTRCAQTRGRESRPHQASTPIRPATRTRRERSITSTSPLSTAA
ncbi:deazapurine DNA modification protein DpdA family protein [Amycolatopsis sp. H20-H5]|uniref:deazapurine DNA modification protein DpdA family protein n=1 Tax=Amycolatopsis sp. H20-H5 TaxID=3046309 RepID=UPI003FA3BD36